MTRKKGSMLMPTVLWVMREAPTILGVMSEVPTVFGVMKKVPNVLRVKRVPNGQHFKKENEKLVDKWAFNALVGGSSN